MNTEQLKAAAAAATDAQLAQMVIDGGALGFAAQLEQMERSGEMEQQRKLAARRPGRGLNHNFSRSPSAYYKL